MLFTFGEEEQIPSQDLKDIELSETEKEINPKFKGEIYSTKTIGGLWKRNQDDIDYESYAGDVERLDKQSDLIPNLYEGGLKTWECSLDLVEYITPSLVQNKTIIELGCGSALPGIKAHLNGALRVDFQDFNQSVLELVTFPNLLINTTHTPDSDGDVCVDDQVDGNSTGSKFYAGDWADLTKIIPSKSYDMIITSETIYSSTSIPRLLYLINHVLTDDGMVILAAKKMYFGCSGGLEVFKTVALEMGFEIERLKEFGNGVAREIIMVKRKVRI